MSLYTELGSKRSETSKGLITDEPHSFVGKIESAERQLDVYEHVDYCEALGVIPRFVLKYLLSK